MAKDRRVREHDPGRRGPGDGRRRPGPVPQHPRDYTGMDPGRAAAGVPVTAGPREQC